MKRMKKMLCTLLAMVMVAGVCVIPTEAKSGAEQVKDIQDAIDNAANGGTVLLTEDILWGTGEPIEIPAGKNITIDLNGFNIESLEPYPIFRVISGAEVIIQSSFSNSIAKNTGMPEEYQEYYDVETMGLFEVQENARLIIKSGTYEAGDNYFTGNSKGEVIIEGGYYNKIPEGKYTIPEWKYMGKSRWDDVYYLQPAISVRFAPDEIEMPEVEQDFELKVNVVNNADQPIENIEVQAGYEDCFAGGFVDQRPHYSFDKAVAGEKYTVSGAKAIIPRIEAGESIWITFSTFISKEMAGKRISFDGQANIIVNGESIDERTGGTGWFCVYQMTTDIRDSISETELTKPVAKVTAVNKQETKNAIKKEVLQLVQDFWIYEEVSEERISVEEINKVSDGFFSGEMITAELALKEMAAEQIASNEETMLVEKAGSELGEKASLRYLDLSLLIQSGNKELGRISKLAEEMAITVAIPDEMKADGGIYKILRCHNGEVAVLETTVNKDGTITFKTDCFSTYALAYVGKVNVVEDEKTQETVEKETQSVVDEIIAGTVADSVVNEKTAEKVAEAVNSGKTVNAEIVVVKVPETEIAQIEQTAIEEKVTAELGEDAKVQYLDVSIVLMAGDEELGTLNELKEEITITVAIPNELKAEGRTYKVIRNHNGVVEVLDTVVNEDGTISFKTDKFSTYALAYADNEETNTNTNTNQSNKTPSTDTKAPQTGDNSSVMVYVAICLVALAAIVVTKRRKVFAK